MTVSSPVSLPDVFQRSAIAVWWSATLWDVLSLVLPLDVFQMSAWCSAIAVWCSVTLWDVLSLVSPLDVF